MDNQLNEAFALVSQHDNLKIKQGEAKLNHLRKSNYYPLGLLIYMNNNQNLQPQLRAAIQLKIWCQSYNNLEVFQRSFYQQFIEQVKNKIVMAYLVFQGKVSQTLRPAIVKLTAADFPSKWEGLIPGLIQYANQNTGSIHSVLLLISDITEKYSYLGRSDPLYEEIILVCNQVHDFILDLTAKIIQASSLDDKTLNILETLMKIFYHLNYQDLHPKFQDNLNNWMEILKKVMNFANSSEAVFKCKGAALESILLYASKYKEDVEESIKGFSSEIWDLCSNATDDPEYDTIVFNSLKYFKSIILWTEMKPFFIDNLPSLIEKLIMPNIKFSKQIIEMFYEEPDSFFEFYFKNGEIGSRRAASLDLLRVICRNFGNFESYVLQRIQQFTANMANASIQQKCNLLNFIIDGSSKSFRDIDGCTQTYINSDYIVQCYEHIVKVDLAQIYNWILNNQNKNIEDDINTMLLVTLMRYCFYFRIFLPTDNYQLIIQFLASINTQSKSIKTLIFTIMNAFMTIRHGDFHHFKDFKFYFNSQNTQIVAKEILQTIYKNDQSLTQLNENLTKMLFTLSKLLGPSCLQYYQYFDALFKQMLLKTNQYDFKSVLFLFQSIGYVAFYVAKSSDSASKEQLQTQIMNYFQVTINRNSDLLNFCFQILAIFLEFENQNVTSHQKIYDSILNIENWTEENMPIMSSYIQYISAYLVRSPANLISDKQKFEMILMRLVELDHFDLFFRFMESILKITNLDQFYEKGYFQLSIHGAESIIQKSIMGRKQAVLFIFRLMNNYVLNTVLAYMNNVSPNLFENIITSSDELIRTMQLKNDRKQMYGALCRVICSGILKPDVEGHLLSLLIDNSTNRFQLSNFRLRESIDEKNLQTKKQGSYQKLQIFRQIDHKEKPLELDEQEQLCKAYIICENDHRASLQVVNEKNHERMKRMKDKHNKSLGNYFSNNQNKIF